MRGAAVLAIACLAAGAALGSANPYQLQAVTRHGWCCWRGENLDSPSLLPSMRRALQGGKAAMPGALIWQSRAAGFETAELPALADGSEVDRLMLERIDPQKFTFAVSTSAAGDKTLPAWMRQAHAVLIVNGSYYGHDGRPVTPVRSAGESLGPSQYDGRAGAFVSSAGFAGIRDLAHQPWTAAFGNARDALVSYPLLIAPGGGKTVPRPSQWLASRSFIGPDRAGNIVIGTTRDRFFSLHALAGFLAAAPLDLTAALNLEGGPVACQGVALGSDRRQVIGKWEFQANQTGGHLLSWLYGDQFAMPVVLAVFSK